ncbi:IS21 family transposase [Pseudolysobacter antarcticus]|uniref:IS21 family transposase n=1 Tax=Pseudolysobacter antarcticus TaxID=2511995 RepID=A0A411HFT7_9GAMM|nr:IS21 family transposase [Pseudolysobacter antarcticus]QBB69355.1 IS21 family transposase [Pseudolysobacter antarcticus]
MPRKYRSRAATHSDDHAEKLVGAVRKILSTALSDRDIAAAVGISKTTVRRYRVIVQAKGLTSDDLNALGVDALCATFNQANRGSPQRRNPNYGEIQKKMSRKGSTLQLLWELYREEDSANALSYPQFTANYRLYVKRLPTVMRQQHRAGERAFVDYSGQRASFFDPVAKKKVEVEVFIGVLGASNYLFATCTRTQQVPDWIHAHVAMLEFFGRVPHIIVPDNLKSAVTKTGSDPTIQRNYRDFADHYDIAILPARPYRPRDKAKAEVGVQIAQRWILARLRDEMFYSLEELNARMAELVHDLNGRPFKKMPGTRKERFDTIDAPAMRPLPARRYVYAEWVGEQTVPQDYHVLVRGHFYSVPHALVGSKVEARVLRDHIELFSKRTLVARHERQAGAGEHSTLPEHQTDAHREYAKRSPEAMITWATRIGPHLRDVVRHQLKRTQPVLGMPACDSLRRLAEEHGDKVLESAARRALEIRSPSLTSIRSILRTGLHKRSVPPDPFAMHANVRGADYYADKASP